MPVTLDGSSLTLEAVSRVAKEGDKVKVSLSSIRTMERFRKLLMDKLDGGEVVYGVNTGFGALSDKGIPRGHIKQLQLNLIRSHAIGVGAPMSEELVRAAMLIRLNGMLNGNSAVRPEVATLIMGMLNGKVTPLVPRFGSLGASGDLAPSAHMALTMVGEGKAYHEGRLIEARLALSRAGLKPIELAAKEGLSLINGTCFTAALACITTRRARLLLEAANSSAALTAEVIGACIQSFDGKLMELRRFRSQAQVARQIRSMLRGSHRVRLTPVPQDPYSIRCVPQVHGSTWEAVDLAERIVTEEINAVTDNPVLTEDGEVLHGGNFHAQPVAMALDFLSIAMAYLGTISLARIHLLLSHSPADMKFGARNPGLESGLMVAEYTASALSADNAKEIYPSSTYPANVSAGTEDHASYGVNSGLKAITVSENISKILAIELLSASNRIRPFEKELSRHDSRVCSKVRSISPPLRGDRSLSEELEKLAMVVLNGELP
jgi:histidine ammonia-lyase